MLYVKLMEYSNAWDRKNVMYREKILMNIFKKILAYVPLVPIMIIEWIMWPIAKIHSGLSSVSRWLREVAQ